MRFFFTLFLLSSYSMAQNNAVRAPQAPVIDGVIESVWTNGLAFNRFNQYDPQFNTPSGVKTIVYFLYDEENIYIAAKLFQSQGSIKSNRYRKDTNELFSGDWFQMNFDPFNKGVTGYYIALNPSNATIDGIIGAGGQENKSFDFISYTATQIFEDRWEIEIQIPLNSIDFQNESVQTWGITFARHYAQQNERSAAHNLLREDPFRIQNYLKINNLKNLNKSEKFSFVPYAYSDYITNNISNLDESALKLGYELKFQPSSDATILVTGNPDFAQIETDAEVINVGDSPSDFPEKRPFFTYNNDMYGIFTGVRTRNIGDLYFGLKYIQEIDHLKFDLTTIYDKDDNVWVLNDIRFTDPNAYKIELEFGRLLQSNYSFTNAVLNLEAYFYNKTLRLWSYLESAGRSERLENSNFLNVSDETFKYGTLAGLTYRTREWNIELVHEYKEALFNPSAIAYWVESNKFNSEFEIGYNFYIENSQLISIRPSFQIQRQALASHKIDADYEVEMELNVRFKVSDHLGIWAVGGNFNPDTDQHFRYRASGLNHPYQDTYSPFTLIKQRHADKTIWWNTDGSKLFSINGWYWNGSIRQAKADNMEINFIIRPTSDFTLGYNIKALDIMETNAYQKSYQQLVHRVKAEYNFLENLNLRGIYQFNDSEQPDKVAYVENEIGERLLDDFGNLIIDKKGFLGKSPTVNLTLSWEYDSGSFIYAVYNDFSSEEGYRDTPLKLKHDTKSFVLKINKTFQF